MFVCKLQSVQKPHLCAGEKRGYRGTGDMFNYGLVTISQDVCGCVCVCAGGWVGGWVWCV